MLFSELASGLDAEALVVDLRFAWPWGARLDWLRLFLDSPQTTGGSVTRSHSGWNN